MAAIFEPKIAPPFTGLTRDTRPLGTFGLVLAIIAPLVAVTCSPVEEPETTEIARTVTMAPWAPGVLYAVGDLVTFDGVTFRCRQAHTSQVGFEPPKTPALWDRPGPKGIQPWTDQTDYIVGSGVIFNGQVFRCIQAHHSQPDFTPPATPALWKLTADIAIPPGVSGTLSFVFKSKNLPAGIADGFGLVQRDPFGDATFTELLDTSQRSIGDVFHRIPVSGGEVFELFLQANKTNATSSPKMTAATYSGDPTFNTAVDPARADHVKQPLQSAAQVAAHDWTLAWESFNFADPGRDGKFDDVIVELRVDVTCNNVTVPCGDPNLVVSSHSSSVADYRGDFSAPVSAPVAGVPAGPVVSPTGGEGNPTPIGATVLVGGRVDTLRWSFVHQATDFTAATPPKKTSYAQGVPGPELLGGGLWSLAINRTHRPRAETVVSSFGPGVFSDFDTKLTLQPSGIGNQNTIVLFDPESDALPVVFSETSQQDGDTVADGRYHDNATRVYASLVLFNAEGTVEPNPFAATTAVATRQTGVQSRFEIINVQGTGATQLQGRLTASADRNGNAATVTYQFPASATNTQLGNDRKKLWLINRVADAHGVGATFHYQLRAGTSRYVVQSIDLPDTTKVQYQYGTDTTNLDRLTKVVYANGDASTFSRTWDAASQSFALNFKDASDGSARTWKTVYVTGPTFTTTDHVVHTQEPNLARRIVNNNGEQLYQATEDPNDANTTFYRLGANAITRLTVDSTGLPLETARATTLSSDPVRATYTTVESYTGDVLGMIRSATDGLVPGDATDAELLSHTRTFVRDSKTRGILAVNARGDIKPAVFTLNSFLQPTTTIDRLGRKVTAVYDGKGNPQSITHAPGTADQGTWNYTYNARGQVITSTDANNHTTDYGYNAAGFLTSITEPPDVAGGPRAVRKFEPDPLTGRLNASVDASGRRVTCQYDTRGRVIKETYPDTSTEITTYGSGATAGVVVSTTDRNGVATRFEYDATRRLTKTTQAAGRPEQIATVVEFLPGTVLPSAQTTAGERIEFTYDERNRQVAMKKFLTDSRSLTSFTAYDDIDRITTETDAYGRRFLHVFDANGRVTRNVRELVPGGVPAGSDVSKLVRLTSPNPPYVIDEKLYDNMNQPKSSIDPRGFTTTRAYDQQGRVTTLIEAQGAAEQRTTTFEYDPVGNLTRQIDPRTVKEGPGFQTAYTYTGRNQISTKVEAAGTADAATTKFTYTPTKKVQTMTDPRGGVTTNGYDACCDRLETVRNPALFATTYSYDFVGNRTKVTTPLAEPTAFKYDGLNRLLTHTDPLGHVTHYEYDDDLTDGVGLDPDIGDFSGPLGFGAKANGSAVRITNAANESAISIADGAGRVVVEVSASGHPTTTTYDAVVGGLVETAVTDAVGNVTRKREDGAGRLRISIDGDGKASTRALDAAGNLQSERDPNGVGKDCVYDGFGQTRACTDTQGDTNLFEYDDGGNRTAKVDGTLVRTTSTFDFRNRRKTSTDGVKATTKWTYDGNSNIATITDGENRVTRYTYDARDLRVTETYPDSSSSTDHVTLTYDADGRLKTRKDQGGSTITYAYDVASRLTTKTDAAGKVDTFNYDAVNRFTKGTSQRYGTSIARGYDFAGRLQTESVTPSATEANRAVTYTYDDADRLSTLTYPDASVVAVDYTNRSQINSITLGTQAIAQYGYDDGRRLKTTTLGNGLVETQSYRADDKVSSIVTPNVGDFTYTYDADKRRTSEGGAAVNGAQALTYDNEGRLTNWTNGTAKQSWSLSLVGDWNTTTRGSTVETRAHDAAHELTKIGSNDLSYDARGNMLKDDKGSVVTYDFENRLLSYTPSGVQSTSYLYDVFGRKVVRIAGGVRTVFVRAREEVIAELDNGTLRAKYVFGGKEDRPLALVASESLLWYSANVVGSIGALTDGSGAVVERYRYDAYGARTVLSATGTVRAFSAVGNQVGFTGQYHEPSTGLVDFRFRQYDPRLGRFISRDDGYRNGMLLYGAYFVPNHTDPTGHNSCVECVIHGFLCPGSAGLCIATAPELAVTVVGVPACLAVVAGECGSMGFHCMTCGIEVGRSLSTPTPTPPTMTPATPDTQATPPPLPSHGVIIEPLPDSASNQPFPPERPPVPDFIEYTRPDGVVVTVYADGTIVHTSADHTTQDTLIPGQATVPPGGVTPGETTDADGNTITTLPDGTTITDAHDGTRVIRTPPHNDGGSNDETGPGTPGPGDDKNPTNTAAPPNPPPSHLPTGHTDGPDGAPLDFHTDPACGIDCTTGEGAGPIQPES